MDARTTMITRSMPGVDDSVRSRLVLGLNQNLANLTDLAAAYKQAHWNVVGIDFAQLHAMFDEFADQTRAYMDTIAERAVAIGGAARGTIQAAVETSSLPPFPTEERDEVRLLTELLGRIDAVETHLRQAMNETGDELATQDVYIDVVRGIEKQRWMIEAHIARP